MTYRCVDQLQKEAGGIAPICELLDVSRSGYYASRKRLREPQRICPVTTQVEAAFEASGHSYGSRRLKAALANQGLAIGRHRVRTIMRKRGLRPVWRRKFVHTTDSRHDLPVAPNLLNREFDPVSPNAAWVADLTYIRTGAGWMYLAAVLDLFSRKIVGWAMAPSMPAELVCQALQMAIGQRGVSPGLIVHSDRGSQYASELHRELLSQYGLTASMSRKGNCWDNSVMERFFLSLKMERVWRRNYANQAEAEKDVADYIVGFYNSVRLHSKLGYQSPNTYERLMTEKELIGVSEKT